MNKLMQRSFVVFVLATLVGCAFLGVPVADTFAKRATLALSNVTAVREATTNLVTAGAITADDAQNVQDQADTARAGIDLAITFAATDPTQAENRLAAAQVILDALKSYLQTQVQP